MTAAILHPDCRPPAERVWTELRFARTPVAAIALIDAAGVDPGRDGHQLLALFGRWKAAGWVRQERPDSGGWLLTAKGRAQRTAPDAPPPDPVRLGAPGPRAFRGRGGQRDRLWQTMRALASFDGVELAMTAGVTPTAAATLVRQLSKAGFLRSAYAHPGRWQKARPFGVKPPAIGQRVGEAGRVELVVRDRNTGGETIIPLRAGSSAAGSLLDGGRS